MFGRKKKFESNSGVIKPGNRLLRLLRSDTGFQARALEMSSRTAFYSAFWHFKSKFRVLGRLTARAKQRQ